MSNATEAARNAAIADLVRQCQVGNEMIAKGNNNSRDHLAAMQAGKPGCAELRTIAADWAGDRKSFIDAMVARGANKATASTQWQKGRK